MVYNAFHPIHIGKNILDFNGKKLTLPDISKIVGIDKRTIFGRIKRGWSFEKAITQKPQKQIGRNC